MFESCIFALMAQLIHRIFHYLQYVIRAKNEHAFHSPFVYDFATKVVYTNKQYYIFDPIEKLRAQLQNNHSTIKLEEIGAKKKGTYEKKISEISRQSVLPKKYAQLLFKCILHFKPNSILELGTNLGLTTAYLAGANETIKVISIEGNAALSELARIHLDSLSLKNSEIIRHFFDAVLPTLLEKNNFDFTFVDGNHTETATVKYFHWIKKQAHENTIIVFDDIYWSKGMTAAWMTIKKDSQVSITFDFYKFGFVFFKTGIEKQNFTIRY